MTIKYFLKTRRVEILFYFYAIFLILKGENKLWHSN